jgi:hypothetical protein
LYMYTALMKQQPTYTTPEQVWQKYTQPTPLHSP